MADLSNTIKAAIKGSIANPEAAEMVISKLEEVPSELEPAASVAAIATPDASDLATSQTLANATKAKVNEIISALKAAGLMDT